MIDIHAHILPGIDDGAADIETSIKMLKIAVDDGIKTIVATPHYYPGCFETPYGEIEGHIIKLKEEAKKNNIEIEIIQGQEVFIDTTTLRSLKNKEIGTINKTKYMLVEFPMDTIPNYALDIIYELRVASITPIIAHPERYEYIINRISTINDIAKEGCLFQINTGSITGIFGKRVQKISEQLMQHNLCNFIASDCHTTNHRSPRISNALNLISINNDKLMNIIVENSQKLIENIDICSDFEIIKDRKSFFQIFGKQ